MLELEHAAARAGEADAAQLAAAREAVRRSLDDVRRIARELRPEALDDLGLQSALRSLCTAARGRTSGVRVERELELEDAASSPEVELVVYRVAQESLTNVVRHAGASQVLVVAAPRRRRACAWSCATTAAACAADVRRRGARHRAACASARCSSARS